MMARPLFKKGDRVRAIYNGALGFHYKIGDIGTIIDENQGGIDVQLDDGHTYKGASLHNWEIIEKGSSKMVTMRKFRREIYEHFAWDNMPERFKDFQVVMKNGKIDSLTLFGNHLWDADVRALHKVFSDVLGLMDRDREQPDENREPDEKTKPMRRIETEE